MIACVEATSGLDIDGRRMSWQRDFNTRLEYAKLNTRDMFVREFLRDNFVLCVTGQGSVLSPVASRITRSERGEEANARGRTGAPVSRFRAEPGTCNFSDFFPPSVHFAGAHIL
jgi:hypothetical protein